MGEVSLDESHNFPSFEQEYEEAQDGLHEFHLLP
jgi:hypothetical protein